MRFVSQGHRARQGLAPAGQGAGASLSAPDRTCQGARSGAREIQTDSREDFTMMSMIAALSYHPMSMTIYMHFGISHPVLPGSVKLKV